MCIRDRSLRAGRGGNIIALAQELYASDSLPYLLERIAEQAPNCLLYTSVILVLLHLQHGFRLVA